MGVVCQVCQQAPATVHVTDIEASNGQRSERHMCEGCAHKEGVTVQQHQPINAILEKLVKHGAGMKELVQATCPACGISFREFRSQGLLGCPNDYKAFEKFLSPLIERAHGQTHHVGKVPSRAGSVAKKTAERQRLHNLLDEAVGEENYELAAKLRDQLRTVDAHEQD